MRLPRFKLRTLMIAVAFAGLMISLATLRQRLRGLAAYHNAQMAEHSTPTPASPFPPPGTIVVKNPESGTVTAYQMTPRAQQHAKKASEYSGSADRIGLLVAVLLLISALVGIVMALRRRKDLPSDPKPQ
ncbi:hypothetical protein Sinac_4515 [Singulisphaera acidiphila DSM 18658]|uniref:Uncharacterized protein n=1 Tax=Singulisphaera acidiphila (strain ATCC BAA-1392 / DSM 18658 / VKM B-2454 / MOB10) TaxID=886293 RepID=L0DIQ3_SINAD|nr:hypothetical protein Sinac_4515 [Singulisphaera acidiphila DSM 18658]